MKKKLHLLSCVIFITLNGCKTFQWIPDHEFCQIYVAEAAPAACLCTRTDDKIDPHLEPISYCDGMIARKPEVEKEIIEAAKRHCDQ